MLNVMMDQRWLGPHGIGRYATALAERLPSIRPLPLSGRPMAPLDPLRSSWALRKYKPDVYFTPGFNPPLWSPVPFVFCLHDLIHVHFTEESDPLKTAYYRWIVRPAGLRAHRVVTDSQFSRDAILEWSGWPEERVVVVRLGVGRGFHPAGPRYEPGYPYLLHVGNAKPHKNRRRLLQAFAASGLAAQCRLLLLGAPERDEVALATALGLRGNVLYAGLVPESLLPDYYRGATALVCPSLYEGFGLPALEAMACGTVVAAARSTSLPEVLGDAAAYFNPLDVTDMARVLGDVVSDGPLRARLAQSGPRRAAGFSWETTAAEVWTILQDAADSAAQRVLRMDGEAGARAPVASGSAPPGADGTSPRTQPPHRC